MAIWLFLASLLAIGAALFISWKAARRGVAWIAIAVGISVFAIRLIQPGDYAVPSGGHLLSAILALGLGALLLFLTSSSSIATDRGGPSVSVQRILLAASPIVLFIALYSTLAELEEVVVLHATHNEGNAADLRLWIVDDAGAGWIQMPIEKADAHGLGEIKMEMTRNGARGCVEVQRFTDLENTRRVQNLRYEKYLVQRLATMIGVFPKEPTGKAAILRITECQRP